MEHVSTSAEQDGQSAYQGLINICGKLAKRNWDRFWVVSIKKKNCDHDVTTKHTLDRGNSQVWHNGFIIYRIKTSWKTLKERVTGSIFDWYTLSIKVISDGKLEQYFVFFPYPQLVTVLLTITLVTAIFTKVWTRTHLLQLHQITRMCKHYLQHQITKMCRPWKVVYQVHQCTSLGLKQSLLMSLSRGLKGKICTSPSIKEATELQRVLRWRKRSYIWLKVDLNQLC